MRASRRPQHRRLRRARPVLLVPAVLLLLVAAIPAVPAGPPGRGIGTRVVNGELAPAGAYPFFAALLTSGVSDPFAAQFCGGSVVAPRIVLTAAHCVDSYPVIDVLVNTNRLEVGYGDRIAVSRIRVHPRWDPVTMRNDLALLYLASPASAPRIPVLPTASAFRAVPGTTARVAGFGCTRYANGAGGGCLGYPNRMYHTTLPIGTNQWCVEALGAGYNATTMQCAGSISASGAAPDACFGDSGGPLMVNGPAGSGAPLLVGLVSWGPGCGEGPTAYTRLSKYRDWLRANGVPIRGPFSEGPPISFSGESRPVSGDFDGDGRGDVLWYSPGTVPDVLWRGRAGGFANGGTFAMGSYRVPVAGDFDGDGRDDILWYGYAAISDLLWRGTASGFRSGPSISMGNYRIPVAGDFDGDGRDDILWYGVGAVSDIVWRGTAAGFRAGPLVSMGAYRRPVAGDFDGDGRDDVLWYGYEGVSDIVWRGTPGGFAPGPAVSMGGMYEPFAGDFDGDGRADVFWDAPESGASLVWRGSPAGFSGLADVYLAGPFQPVPGDFDGDGRADLLMYGSGTDPDLVLRGNPR